MLSRFETVERVASLDQEFRLELKDPHSGVNQLVSNIQYWNHLGLDLFAVDTGMWIGRGGAQVGLEMGPSANAERRSAKGLCAAGSQKL